MPLESVRLLIAGDAAVFGGEDWKALRVTVAVPMDKPMRAYLERAMAAKLNRTTSSTSQRSPLACVASVVRTNGTALKDVSPVPSAVVDVDSTPRDVGLPSDSPTFLWLFGGGGGADDDVVLSEPVPTERHGDLDDAFAAMPAPLGAAPAPVQQQPYASAGTGAASPVGMYNASGAPASPYGAAYSPPGGTATYPQAAAAGVSMELEQPLMHLDDPTTSTKPGVAGNAPTANGFAGALCGGRNAPPPPEYEGGARLSKQPGIHRAEKRAPKAALVCSGGFILVGLILTAITVGGLKMFCNKDGDSTPAAPDPTTTTTPPVTAPPPPTLLASRRTLLEETCAGSHSHQLFREFEAQKRRSRSRSSGKSSSCKTGYRSARGAEFLIGILPLALGLLVALVTEYHVEWDDKQRRLRTLWRPAMFYPLPFMQPAFLVTTYRYDEIAGVDVEEKDPDKAMCKSKKRRGRIWHWNVSVRLRSGKTSVIYRGEGGNMPPAYTAKYTTWANQRLNAD